MARGISIGLGLGLLALSLLGWAQGATSWLSWIVGVAALVSFAMAANVGTATGLGRFPALLATALLIAWLAGLTAGATGWLTWAALAFACAYLLFAAAILPTLRLRTRTAPP